MPGTPLMKTPVCGVKRKCTTEESSSSNHDVTAHAKGEVDISDGCANGKFIKLHKKDNNLN
jgi:hypothetical protein